MAIKFAAGQQIGTFTLVERLDEHVGGEAWYASASGGDGDEVLVYLVTDPEVQIILREQCAYLENLLEFGPPTGVQPLVACNPYSEPPYTAEPRAASFRPLAHLLRENAPLPVPQALQIFRKVLNRIDALHTAGQPHGIVRPDHILLNETTGEVRLSGLGWGRVASTMLRRSILQSTGTDEPDDGVYFAPEQSGSALGFAPPADIHALGVLLFELLTGHLPNSGHDRLTRPGLSKAEEFEAVFRDCVSEDPRRRPPSAVRIAEMLPHPGDDSDPNLQSSSTARMPVAASPLDPLRPKLVQVHGTGVELPAPYPYSETSHDTVPAEVRTFYVATTPITARLYALFLRSLTPEEAEPYILLDEFCTVARSAQGAVPQRGLGNHPVNAVSYAGAEAFCRWLSQEAGHPFRLPTLAEWLAAAGTPRGTSQQWPWGTEEPTPDHATFGRRWCDLGLSVMEPVDAHPIGSSPCGALAMCGGVGEWTSTTLAQLPSGADLKNGDAQAATEIAAIVGGSWFDEADEIQPRLPRLMPRHFRRVTMGFRVVSDQEPGW